MALDTCTVQVLQYRYTCTCTAQIIQWFYQHPPIIIITSQCTNDSIFPQRFKSYDDRTQILIAKRLRRKFKPVKILNWNDLDLKYRFKLKRFKIKMAWYCDFGIRLIHGTVSNLPVIHYIWGNFAPVSMQFAGTKHYWILNPVKFAPETNQCL